MSGTSRVRPAFERGRASVSGQSIASESNFTKTITLGRNDYIHGIVVIGNPASITAVNQRRLTANIHVTRTLSQAVAQSSNKELVEFISYQDEAEIVVIDWSHRAFFYSEDSRLSDSIFQEEELNVTSSTGNRLLSAEIDGVDLNLVFRNTHVSLARTLTVDIEYSVQKKKDVS